MEVNPCDVVKRIEGTLAMQSFGARTKTEEFSGSDELTQKEILTRDMELRKSLASQLADVDERLRANLHMTPVEYSAMVSVAPGPREICAMLQSVQAELKLTRIEKRKLESMLDQAQVQNGELNEELDQRKAAAVDAVKQEQEIVRLGKENRALQAQYELERTNRLAVLDELEGNKIRLFNLEHQLSEMEFEKLAGQF